MPRQIQIFINVLAIAIMVVIGVDIFYKANRLRIWRYSTGQVSIQEYPESVDRIPNANTDHSVIIDRNLFGARGLARQGGQADIFKNLEPTSLKLKLLGTIAGDSKSGRAIIEDIENKSQALYKIDDSVQNAVVKRIFRGKVILRVNGSDEILTMLENKKSDSALKAPHRRSSRRGVRSRLVPSRNSIVISRQEIAASLREGGRILGQLDGKPVFENGVATGVLLKKIMSGTIFEKMGLRNGDIIKVANNKRMNTPDDILALLQNLQSINSLNLLVTRDENQKILNYSIRE